MIIYPIDETNENNKYTLQNKYKFRPEDISIEKLDINFSNNSAKHLILFFAERKKWTFFTKTELIKFIRKNKLKLRAGEDPLFYLFGHYVYYTSGDNVHDINTTPVYVIRSRRNDVDGFVVTNLFIDRCILGESQEFMKFTVKKIIIPEYSEIPSLTKERQKYNDKLNKIFDDKTNTFIKIFLKCSEYNPSNFISSLYKKTGITKFLLLGGCPHYYSDIWGRWNCTEVNNDKLNAIWLFQDGNIPKDKLEEIDRITNWDELELFLSGSSNDEEQ